MKMKMKVKRMKVIVKMKMKMMKTFLMKMIMKANSRSQVMTILNILPMSLMVESGEEQEKIVRANSYCAMLQLALIKTTKNFRGGCLCK